MSKMRHAFKRARDRRRGASFVRQADLARDRKDWLAAAPCYARGHAIMPWRSDLLIQAGNCHKEAGDFLNAVKLYRAAAEDARERQEADKQLQDVDDRVLRLWERENHGAGLDHGGQDASSGIEGRQIEPSLISGQIVIVPDRHVLDLGGLNKRAPASDCPMDPINGRPLTYSSRLSIIQVGNFKVSVNGELRPLLTGIVAIRIKLVAYAEIDSATVKVNGNLILREEVHLVQSYPDGRFLYIANLWIDCDPLAEGLQSLDVAAVAQDGTILSRRLAVDIVHTPAAFHLPASDAFVSSPSQPHDDLTGEVRSRAATVRSTNEMGFSQDIRSLVAFRIDQLGDLSASLPALRRLRELFPAAHITAIVASALTAIVAASNLVDEVIGLATDYDSATQCRHIEDHEVQLLRNILRGRRFDLAMDLCPNPESRHLLLLVEAHTRVGFYPQLFTFLDFGVEITSRDKANDHSTQSHASLILSLVEDLWLKIRPILPPVSRHAPATEALNKYGLRAGRYMVIHCGARHAINRWPEENFLKLAAMLRDHTKLKIVLFPDHKEEQEQIERASTVEIIKLGQIEMGEFDAILAHAHAMIGNDSGPKHLAAVRGTWTASIHVNRLNWSEWGQNGPGIIISKKTPCGGCSLNDDRLCGKDVACLRGITVEEVFAAVMENMPEPTSDL